MRKFIVFCTLLAILAGCSPERVMEWHKSEGAVWNTLYSITYKSDCQLDDSIIAVMKEVEMSLSPFNPKSLVSCVNRGEDVTVDSMFMRVFQASRMVNALSGGMFDPTVAPLVNYWGFGYADASDCLIDSVMALVGMSDCSIRDGRVIKKHPDTEFNFSAITKGFGCDAVGEMLRRNGCDDFLIEIGGELCVSGKSPRGGKWNVMVDAPLECADSVIHSQMLTISVSDCGIATSGNYRNYRMTGAGKVSHTINPRTGRPVTLDQGDADTTVLSATVVAPTAMLADALATASMLIPPSKSVDMVRKAGGQRLILALSTSQDSLMLIDSEIE